MPTNRTIVELKQSKTGNNQNEIVIYQSYHSGIETW